jgi:hypothetical protein
VRCHSCLTSAEESWQFESDQGAQEDQHDGNKVATCHGAHLQSTQNKTHPPSSALSRCCRAFFISAHMCWWLRHNFHCPCFQTAHCPQLQVGASFKRAANSIVGDHCHSCCCCPVLNPSRGMPTQHMLLTVSANRSVTWMIRALRANSKLAAVLNVNRTAFIAMPAAQQTRYPAAASA